MESGDAPPPLLADASQDRGPDGREYRDQAYNGHPPVRDVGTPLIGVAFKRWLTWEESDEELGQPGDARGALSQAGM